MDAVLETLREGGAWVLEALASCCCGPGDTEERPELGERARLLGETDR